MPRPLTRSLPDLPSTLGATAYDIDRPPVKLGSVPDSAPLIGRRIDHFEVRGLLGQGGMGTVYLAHDLSLERPVAIKVLRRELASDANLVGRLVLEARAQARLQHPNVVTIYHIGSYERAPYFAMEYVHGKTLADRVEIDGPLPWAEALEYIVQTTRALMTAHARGVVHRDIKPSNLILDGAPGAGPAGAAVKVADFGLAAAPGSAEKDFVGSPFYASPEQIAGESPSYRSDIYALGITFHELLTGAPPFQAPSLRKMRSLHLHAPRPPIAARRAPWRLRQLVTEMMDPDPFKRPGSYEALLERLESVRPRPPVAGGVAARAMALAVDLVVLGVLGEGLTRLAGLPTRLAQPLALLLFAAYYIVGHRLWGKTIGKRLLRLRIQGTTRPVTVPGLALRFVVELWAPLTAALMAILPLGDLPTPVLGLPVVDGLLRMVQVPNLPLAVPWVCGFLCALSGENCQALHDRAAHTRVVYELRPRS
jgi:uncharacterized RDD family membrane protein YckC